MSAPENPQAFPFAAEYGHPAACGGMTLRDWFAGQYLAGIHAGGATFASREMVAEEAFGVADAMLASREQQP